MVLSGAENQKLIRARRKARGLCGKCGKPPAPGFKSCRDCLDKACVKVKSWHARKMQSPEYREWYRVRQREASRKMRADPAKRMKDNARSQVQMRARRDLIQAIKIEKGCTDCGWRGHGEALDFDHLDPKEKKSMVSRIKTLSLESLMAEIAKCEVVCSRCHRIRTAKRRAAAAIID